MFQVIEVFLSDILVLDRSVAKPVRKVRLGGTSYSRGAYVTVTEGSGWSRD